MRLYTSHLVRFLVLLVIFSALPLCPAVDFLPMEIAQSIEFTCSGILLDYFLAADYAKTFTASFPVKPLFSRLALFVSSFTVANKDRFSLILEPSSFILLNRIDQSSDALYFTYLSSVFRHFCITSSLFYKREVLHNKYLHFKTLLNGRNRSGGGTSDNLTGLRHPTVRCVSPKG